MLLGKAERGWPPATAKSPTAETPAGKKRAVVFVRMSREEKHRLRNAWLREQLDSDCIMSLNEFCRRLLAAGVRPPA